MFCPYCGAEVSDNAVVCVTCGGMVGGQSLAVQKSKNSTMITVIKVFLILGCIAEGWAIIPLLWCIPMTVSVFKSLNTGRPVSVGLKVCVLIFLSLVGGICLLCSDDL